MWFTTAALPYPNLCGFVVAFKDVFIINQIQNIFKGTVKFLKKYLIVEISACFSCLA